jgi:AhpD family alkylhydroperoxidase
MSELEITMPDNPFQQLETDYPEIAQALSASVGGLLELSGLDEKTRQLTYIAAQTAVCYPLALKYHVPLALKAGATPREVVGAAAIAAAAAGPKSFVMCYPTIKEEIEAYGIANDAK